MDSPAKNLPGDLPPPLPPQILHEFIIEWTNNVLVGVNSARTSLGEMLRVMGMWLLMSCYVKSPNYFWRPQMMTEKKDEDEENDTPLFSFSQYMSQHCFLALTSALRFTESVPPNF